MRIEELKPAQRRLLAVAMLVAVLAMAAGVIVVPYALIARSYDNDLERLNGKLATYRAIVHDGEVANKQLQLIRRIEADNGYFIASDKPALASAELQKRVKIVIEQSGGSIVSSQMMGEKSIGGIEKLQLRVQMRCGVDELKKIINSLEGGAPLLIIENLIISARPSGSLPASQDKNVHQQLDVRFDVAGYRRSEVRSSEGGGRDDVPSKAGR